VNVEAYPLQWPSGWQRTPPAKRRSSRYQVSPGRSQADLLNSLRLLKARYVTISSNVPLKRNGMPYANSRPPDDPGVACYWERDGKSEVVACDVWLTVDENIRAIYYAIEAMRQIERCGASEILNRAFGGFAALPPGAMARSWRAVLGMHEGSHASMHDITEAYRRLAKERHPDRGGSEELMVELNAAHQAALREVIL
jgi:hypothetical protein